MQEDQKGCKKNNIRANWRGTDNFNIEVRKVFIVRHEWYIVPGSSLPRTVLLCSHVKFYMGTDVHRWYCHIINSSLSWNLARTNPVKLTLPGVICGDSTSRQTGALDNALREPCICIHAVYCCRLHLYFVFEGIVQQVRVVIRNYDLDVWNNFCFSVGCLPAT